MRLTSTGLGIGTSSPGAKLDVRGNLNLGDGTSNSNITNTVDTAFMLISGGTSTQNNIRLYGPSHPTLANVQTFITNGSERMRLDSSGNLGLGVTPSAWDTTIFRTAQIGTGAGSVSLSGRADGGKDLVLGSNLYYGTGNFRYVGSGTATMYRMDGATHSWSYATSGTAGNIISFTTALTLNTNGALVLQGGNTSASGVGITFPATQSASSDANTLDDYEEGTFTPGVSFGGGTTGITYTEQNGRYTKIGRQVTVTANVTLSSKGSSTGDAALTGLPFTNGTARSAGSIYSAQITFADFLSILVEASNTIAYFRETTNAGVVTDLTNADFANNSNWTATITYFV
jgi:hypothetical protein